MKKNHISQEELDEEIKILEAFEQDELKSISNANEEIQIAKMAAKNWLKDNKVIEDVEIGVKDFTIIKKLALKREMSYKDLISEIIHNYAIDHLKKIS